MALIINAIITQLVYIPNGTEPRFIQQQITGQTSMSQIATIL